MREFLTIFAKLVDRQTVAALSHWPGRTIPGKLKDSLDVYLDSVFLKLLPTANTYGPPKIANMLRTTTLTTSALLRSSPVCGVERANLLKFMMLAAELDRGRRDREGGREGGRESE